MYCPERNRVLQCHDNLNACNSENRGHWEKFDVIFDGPTRCSFKSHKGTYLKADPDLSCRFDAYQIGDWEKFTIVPVENGLFAI
jgi:hypothetical protein